MDIEQIKSLTDLMVDNDLTEIMIRDGETRVILRRGCVASAQPVVVTAPPAPAAIALPEPAAGGAPGTPAPADDGLVGIKSPMVGTFYAASDPESPPFANVGDPIHAESVVCIIEAMKVFNEIKAETTGTITSIEVQNGQSVEFGQILFKVRPS